MGYWTLDRISAVAASFETRTAFQRGHNTAYVIAFRRGWLDDVCGHMQPTGSRMSRFVYRIWNDKRDIYIGIACNVERRLAAHRSFGREEVRALLAAAHHVEAVTPKPLPASEAVTMECNLIEQYRAAGWNVLNVAKAGGLGGHSDRPKWTAEALAAEAAKYKTRAQFRAANQSAYVLAHRYGLIESLFTGHPNDGLAPMRVRNGTWTLDALTAEAAKFPNRFAMAKTGGAAYQAAHKTGVIDEIFANHPFSGYLNAAQEARARRLKGQRTRAAECSTER